VHSRSIPRDENESAILATDISSVPARRALGRDPGTMVLVTPISLAMTRFFATAEKMQAKIVPGLGTLWNLPGTEMFVVLIYMVSDRAWCQLFSGQRPIKGLAQVGQPSGKDE